MKIQRPDLSNSPPNIREYIESLESELEILLAGAKKKKKSRDERKVEARAEIAEPATTINLIVATADGFAKRTPRHEYIRQRRGGMGIFDIETKEEHPPSLLVIADRDQYLLAITNQARVFRIPVKAILETEVRSRGLSIVNKIGLLPDESLSVLLPDKTEGYLAAISENGMVRLLRHHVFGEYMKPGTPLYNHINFGLITAGCWTPGDADLFIATKKGRAIRFSEKLVSPKGSQGIRLSPGDSPIGITSVTDSSGVLLLGTDGKGIIRLMSGFAPNKSLGGGGKLALKTNQLMCAQNVDDCEDVFVITKLSKLIRFGVDEIPNKDGVVQGVVYMTLRADEPTAVALSHTR